MSRHSNRDEVISARPAHVGFVVNKVTLRQIFLLYLTLRLGSRLKQLLNNVKERRILWKLKEEAIDHAVWRRGCGPDVSWTA